ncbi:MAG: thiamine phosphate synthase [Mesorhizobium sp.]|uniref:thiamine phosphate synthase n=1 Tax=Aquamicrobium sp. TaxID=1872579 RepID=UPI0026191EA5|nr:thiamine phosphate synthase [Mesorhizobium sp.]MCO5146593.1 thiamine phosphate synthase [Aquamicrobium sp.]MCO5162124.1 thiamine phosphate synthase [Mesorhizobium sp.]
MTDDLPNRCRLVLIADPNKGGMEAQRVVDALSGGDVASLILVGGSVEDAAFQAYCEAIVPSAQAKGVAVLISGDSRIVGRVGADGIHLETGKAEIDAAVRKHDGRLIVGAGGAKTRHDALELGEAQPDYIFFGRFGYDQDPAPHPRNLDLAQWWAEIVNVPCIAQGGSDIASVEAVAATGAEFVALSSAVFGGALSPADAVRSANDLLDRTAPRFEE